MDFLEHDLKTLLEEHLVEPFLPSEIKTLMSQLVFGTQYLHSNWILHRDLKTSNLLLNNRGELKIADFGMARYTGSPPPSNLTQLVVTLWYRAPELLLGAHTYTSSIDTWSIGCIFAELLTREPLFQGRNEVDQLSKIFSLLGTPTATSWPEFHSLPNAKALFPLLSNSRSSPKSRAGGGITSSRFPYLTSSGLALLSSLLSQNPSDRPTATQVLSHPYFSEEPRAKPKEMFPTFPSKAGQEKRRRRHETPPAPRAKRGEEAPRLKEEDFQSYRGLFMTATGDGDDGDDQQQMKGAGFALKLG